MYQVWNITGLTTALFLTLALGTPQSAHAQQKSAADLFKEGNEYFQAGLYKKAITAYKESVAQDPDFKEAWYNLGVSYGRKGKYKNETAAYNKAIALDPKYSRAVFNLALAREDSGDSVSYTHLTLPTKRIV